MFNVERPSAIPPSLAKKKYNHTDVVSVLKPMFYGKCYLCERDAIQDVEVEHFDPHKSVEAKKFDWQNLFYSCSRCNSIKGAKHTNLLDCTDPKTDVFNAIILKMPSAPDDNIIVKANHADPSDRVINTVALLELCYNHTNTALRGVSRENLIEQIYNYKFIFMTARQELRKPSTGKSKKQDAVETIEAMLDVKHPFSAFWRWQYLDDSFLTENYPQLKSGF